MRGMHQLAADEHEVARDVRGEEAEQRHEADGVDVPRGEAQGSAGEQRPAHECTLRPSADLGLSSMGIPDAVVSESLTMRSYAVTRGSSGLSSPLRSATYPV